MKLVSFKNCSQNLVGGWVDGELVVDMHEASGGELPNQIFTLIEDWDDHADTVKELAARIEFGDKGVYHEADVQLHAPLPRPVSFRDFYAFEQHVKTARGKRGLDVVPEWYDFPVFYFSNHLAIKGPQDTVDKPHSCEWLDYELEIACIIGKEGKDITVEEAEEHIFGYCILNDWSARDLQREEMKVGLGPAKGKDFATSIGPWLVTKDELEAYRIGDRFDLEMTASVNGELLSKGNYKDIHYTFAEMIARASEGVTLYPGEVIGSGTVGTGCILELGTDIHPWLKPGDEVELEITGLGQLNNKIRG
ncbi:fumarylacetoacetate hydrolase family protein [Thalassobacillus hwangdonensis]|uniref:Fumarylacetoacetate hydrolase family protein n=1 Tax=Thalassobacillus hwangdonensis TaxID=546108 RepID=A0ABW3KZD6_9BACI